MKNNTLLKYDIDMDILQLHKEFQMLAQRRPKTDCQYCNIIYIIQWFYLVGSIINCALYIEGDDNILVMTTVNNKRIRLCIRI